MKQPPSPLQTLRDHIHRVHGVFLDALKYRFERAQGHQINSTQWFMILTQNADFAWFRPLTQLATEIDILLDEETLSDEQIDQFTEKARRLFSLDDAENIFAARFFEMIPQEPELMLVYPRFREALKNTSSSGETR